MLVKDNKYIPEEDKDFFILLRIGLWQCVTEELSPNPNWEYIFKISCEQTVQGIIADGIGLYRKEHSDLQITVEQNDKFLSASAQIVRQNFKVNQLQAKLCSLFNDQGVTYTVLKGQGAALCYPKPNLRCSGDIDFLFDDNHYKLANAILQKKYTAEESNGMKHIRYTIDDIDVELHANEFIALGEKTLQKYVAVKNKVMQQTKEFRHYDNNGVTTYLPPVTFDAFYIFFHFLKHFLGGGLGIRQIIDWTMFLYENKEQINTAELQTYLNKFSVNRAWNTFAVYANLILGLPEEKLPKVVKTSFCKSSLSEIWQQCKEGGNMGHVRGANSTALTLSENRAKQFRNLNLQFCRNFPITPRYSLIKLAKGYIRWTIRLRTKIQNYLKS